MRLYRILLAGLVVSLSLVNPLNAGSLGNVLRKAAGSIALLEFNVEGPLSAQNGDGVAFCVERDAKGRSVFMTSIIPQRVLGERMKEFRVTPANLSGPARVCEFIGIDPASGLGFVRTVESCDWPVVNIPDKADVKLAQRVMSVGLAPRGYNASVQMSLAYVGGIYRVPEKLYRVTGGTLYGTGALVFDMEGNVVGMVGLQLPEAMKLRIARRSEPVILSETDRKIYFLDVSEFSHALRNIPSPQNPVNTAWIGVIGFNGVTQKNGEVYSLDTPAVMVGYVVPDKSAAIAGLKQRDLIVSVNGKSFRNFEISGFIVQELVKRIQLAGVGNTVKLGVLRGSKKFFLDVTIDTMPMEAWQADMFYFKTIGLMAREKVEMDRYLDRGPNARYAGILVLQIAQKSPAEQVSVKQGDLIVAVNKQLVQNLASMKRIINEAGKDQPIELQIKRGVEDMTIKITR